MWPDALPGWLHPHLIELLAYPIGFQVFLLMRKKGGDTVASASQRAMIIAAAALGAAFGARVLFWLEDPAFTLANIADPGIWSTGRTIVGALLGGWIAVEVAKAFLGIRRSTGDVVVFPLLVGLFIGRIGCFLSGISDGTHGVPTSLPVGMDLGDGIPRHPTMLYELLFLVGLGAALWVLRGSEREGTRWERFLFGYLSFRFIAEFLKTQPFFYFGLSGIQLACLATLVVLAWRMTRSSPQRSPA